MRRNNTVNPLLWAVPALPILYLAALLASGYKEDMTVFDLMGCFSELLGRPFAIHWTEHTLKFMLAALLVYGFTVVLYLSTRENRRPGEEHGSAKWGDPKQLNAKYRDKDPFQNTILTQNVRMGLNGKIHRRNLLQIVIGGSGAGKTRFFVKPNLMQANCSFLVTDPKGETMRAVAPLLLERGYVIKVFDLIDTGRSDAFNPFPYLKDDKDAMKLVNNLIKNTTPKNASNSDPFWEKSEIALDTALILYLLHEAPPEEQNFEMVMYMIENGGAREDDDDFQSPLDMLFEALEEEKPDHVAVREYKIFKQAAGYAGSTFQTARLLRPNGGGSGQAPPGHCPPGPVRRRPEAGIHAEADRRGPAGGSGRRTGGRLPADGHDESTDEHQGGCGAGGAPAPSGRGVRSVLMKSAGEGDRIWASWRKN